MADTKDEILDQNNSGGGGNTGTDTNNNSTGNSTNNNTDSGNNSGTDSGTPTGSSGTDSNPQKNNADANPQPHENGGTGEQSGGNSTPVNNGSALTGGNNDAGVNTGLATPPPNNVNNDNTGNGSPEPVVNKPTDNGNNNEAPTNTEGGNGNTTPPVDAPKKEAPANDNGQVQGQNNDNNNQGEKQMSYVDMLNQLNPYKAPTQEELEKERKKEKREKLFAAIGDGLSALANLYFVNQGAPNMYDPQNSMYEKTKQRWDKLNNERKENSRAYLSAYMQAKQADDANNRDNRNWQHQLKREGIEDQRFNQNIEHRDKREAIEDQRYNQNIEHRDKREQVEDEHWNKNFQMQEKQFNESVRQFNVTSAQNAQRIKMESRRLAREMKTDKVTFALGTGKGTISIPTNALNAANVSYVFSKLPANVQATCVGEAVYDSKKKKVVGHKAPTTEAMLVCIGANIEGNASAQNALREIGGQKPKNSSETPVMLQNTQETFELPWTPWNNTPPSRSNDNTPPSRRKK